MEDVENIVCLCVVWWFNDGRSDECCGIVGLCKMDDESHSSEVMILGCLLLLFNDLLGGQRILFARLGGLQLFRVERLDVGDEVQLLFLLDNWK